MGLFTGFSVISGIELLYWIIFKVIEKTENRGLKITFLPRQVFFHKKDVESSDGEDKKELGWRERRSQNDEASEVSNFNKPSTSWERIIYTFNKSLLPEHDHSQIYPQRSPQTKRILKREHLRQNRN